MSRPHLIRLCGVVAVAAIVAVSSAACSRKEPPAIADAGPPPPPPPPPAVVDAGPDIPDATDASDARGPARKAARAPAAGGVGLAGLSVSGTLPKADVAKVLRAGGGALRACYDKAHAANPSLKGRAKFNLTVDRRGRVTLGEVATSTLNSNETEMCMAQATRTFKFPPPPDGAESTVTFEMSFGGR